MTEPYVARLEVSVLDMGKALGAERAANRHLKGEVERLREALAFYAERSSWTATNPPGSGAPCWHDHGQRAQAALDA